MTAVFHRRACESRLIWATLGQERDQVNRPQAISDEQRELFEAAVAAKPSYPAERYAGRGIVICAGGARLFTCAYVAIGILRRIMGCRLPIQLWHLGPQELGPPMRALLKQFDVEMVDALDTTDRPPMRIVGGWELKPYAIIHSRFREVFLLDADNVALIDPAELFDLPQYAATGAVFWPDIVQLRADNPIWDICGIAYRATSSFESGQLLVDKQRCWHALQLTMHMNEHSDFFYRHLYGDKDTFLMAWLRLGQPYAITGHAPQLRNTVLHQCDFSGRPIFQHRSQTKWSFSSANPRIPGFEHEEACFALLEELHEQWNGRVFNPPPMSPAARACAASLRRIERFTYLKTGSTEKILQLLDDNRIGEGRDKLEFYWWVEEDGEGLMLGFEGRRRTSGRLRPMSDGTWRGRSAEPEAWEVQLAPCATGTNPQEPVIASAVALLETLLASPVGRPADKASAEQLTVTLKVLGRAIPGFTNALVHYREPGRLADLGETAAACLGAALGELREADQASWSGEKSPSWALNLGTHYRRSE
jgi:hypothetical protein